VLAEARVNARTSAARDLLAIGALAFALRAAWTLVYGRYSGGAGDAPFFAQVATSLADGDGFVDGNGVATAQSPPGFPFLIALGYKVVGVHVKLGLAFNVVLGTATALLLYLVGRELCGRAGGLVAGGLFAILPSALFFTGVLYSETTLLFLMAAFLALAVFLPDRAWTPVVLGVVAGLATLTKGDGALLAVIPAAMWWGQRSRGEWVRRVAILLAALALTVLPWTIRNAVAVDSFVPLATNDAAAIWTGHNQDANGFPVIVPEEPPGELRRDALSWAVRHPHKELGLIPRRLLGLAQAPARMFRYGYNDDDEKQLGTSSLLVFTVLGDALDYLLIMVAITALVVLGPRRLWRWHPLMRGVLGYLAASLAVYGLVYYGEFRYRMPLVPLMTLLATPLLVTLWQRRASLRGEPA
jgi:4-amino-4-deoxy-L-arabinose transferase-like glycosyltransferase